MTRTFGHYEIVGELGRGGMGVVYRALDTSLNRAVALKVLGQQVSNDADLIERFRREAQSAASLNHPNVIQIYFFGEEAGQHYFVMEFVQGESLADRIRRQKQIPPREAAAVLLQSAQGLKRAHDAGIVHRDIKPGNIMINHEGVVKVADFGIAMVHNAEKKLTATGQFLGTPGYLSPEVCLGKPTDLRSDIFALGIVYFEMLTGSLPFHSDSPLQMLREVVEAPVPDVRALNNAVDLDTHLILSSMIEKDPDKRYQHCGALISALERYLGSDVPSLAFAAAPTPPPASLDETVAMGAPGTQATQALAETEVLPKSTQPTQPSPDVRTQPAAPPPPPTLPTEPAQRRTRSDNVPPPPPGTSSEAATELIPTQAQASAATTSEAPPPPPPQRPRVQANPAPTKKKGAMLPLLLVIGLVLIAGAGFGVWSLMQPGDDAPSAGEPAPPSSQSMAEQTTPEADPSEPDTAVASAGATETATDVEIEATTPEEEAAPMGQANTLVANVPEQASDPRELEQPDPASVKQARQKKMGSAPDGILPPRRPALDTNQSLLSKARERGQAEMRGDDTAGKTAPARPVPPGVARVPAEPKLYVWAKGPNRLQPTLQRQLTQALIDDGFDVLDADLLQPPERLVGNRLDLAGLGTFAANGGADVLVVVEAVETGTREVSPGGRSTTLTQVELTFKAYFPEGRRKLGSDLVQSVEFAPLTMRRNTEKAILDVIRNLSAAITP